MLKGINCSDAGALEEQILFGNSLGDFYLLIPGSYIAWVYTFVIYNRCISKHTRGLVRADLFYVFDLSGPHQGLKCYSTGRHM